MQADEAFMEVDKLQILLDDLNEALISNDIHEIIGLSRRYLRDMRLHCFPDRRSHPQRPGSQGNVIEIKPDL